MRFCKVIVACVLITALICGCNLTKTSAIKTSTIELIEAEKRQNVSKIIFYPTSTELADEESIQNIFNILDKVELRETAAPKKDGGLEIELIMRDDTSERIQFTSKYIYINHIWYKTNIDICNDIRAVFGLIDE